MDDCKRFNKCCKMMYKVWLQKDPCKEMKLISNAFQVLKTVNKEGPITFFIENVVQYEKDIMKRDINVINKFVNNNPIYKSMKKGVLQSWSTFDEEFQSYMWDHVETLLEFSNSYIKEKQFS